MKTHWLKNFFLGLIGALVLAFGLSIFTTSNASISFYYTITDLGTLGGSSSSAYGINDRGQVVGQASTASNNSHAFLWASGTMTDLGTLGGSNSVAYDINNAEQVVGTASISSTSSHAFLWTNGTTIDIGGLAAYAINNTGQIVGTLMTATVARATSWTDGNKAPLAYNPAAGPGGSSYAGGINKKGQIVGGATADRHTIGMSHATLWVDGTLIELDTLGGPLYSGAEDINNAGQIIGYSSTTSSPAHATLWQNDTITDLGSLSGSSSYAYAINDRGRVVGKAQISSSNGLFFHAFVWSNGKMRDLNNLLRANSGWELREARDINNKGQIVGQGQFNSQTRAFLLTPTWVIR